MENKKIFREKSLERISSPDKINDYIKTTTPGIWIVLIAVLLILAGAIVWSVFGRITVNTPSGSKTVAPVTYILPSE
ncbi:MAG: hypothetical protein ACSW73_01120 [Spirochaetales bacterium]|jgi:hypothetical protein